MRHESALAIPDHVLTRRATGEAVLLDLHSEQYYGLDGAGSRLWELIENGTTIGQAIDALFDEYDVTRETLEADVLRVLSEMHSSGLVLVDDE